MKKALSLLLALMMALSVCTAVPAFAEQSPDYYNMNFVHGEKAGQIYGKFEKCRRMAANLDGCEEVEALLADMLDKTHDALVIAKNAALAVTEVEKDKIDIASLEGETQDVPIRFLEGLASRLGDPSGTARNNDVIAADCNAAKSDAETALNNGNRKTAERAVFELSDAEEMLYELIETTGNSTEFLDKYSFINDLYERTLKVREKTQADVEKANRLYDEYSEAVMTVLNLMVDAYDMMTPIVASAPADTKAQYTNLQNELGEQTDVYEDFRTAHLERPSVDMSRFDTILDRIDRELHFSIKGLREDFITTLMPRFFIAPNKLTADGTAQPLVTLGTDMEDVDTSQIKYALGSMPDKVTEDAVIINASLDDGEYSSAVPTATKAGIYYVYCKFPYSNRVFDFCVKVTVASGESVKPDVKKANTLKATGKTVNLKAKILKKKDVTVERKKAITVKGAKGKVTYKKAKGNKKIAVAKNGKITVKKGLKKGTYTVKIKVKAAGNANYKAATKTVTVTITVK